MPPVENAEKKERDIHDAFLIGIVLKGLNGLFELLVSFLLLYSKPIGLLHTLIQNELIDDPNDFLATHVAQLIDIPSHTRIFAGIYLLGHGLLKVIFAAGLLKNYAWAYPVGIAFLTLFIGYDLYRVIVAHSIVFAFLTLFDSAILWLVWHEYKHWPHPRNLILNATL